MSKLVFYPDVAEIEIPPNQGSKLIYANATFKFTVDGMQHVYEIRRGLISRREYRVESEAGE